MLSVAIEIGMKHLDFLFRSGPFPSVEEIEKLINSIRSRHKSLKEQEAKLVKMKRVLKALEMTSDHDETKAAEMRAQIESAELSVEVEGEVLEREKEDVQEFMNGAGEVQKQMMTAEIMELIDTEAKTAFGEAWAYMGTKSPLYGQAMRTYGTNVTGNLITSMGKMEGKTEEEISVMESVAAKMKVLTSADHNGVYPLPVMTETPILKVRDILSKTPLSWREVSVNEYDMCGWTSVG
jgi:hypothetical protein